MVGVMAFAVLLLSWIAMAASLFPPSGKEWTPVSGSWNVPVLRADPDTWEHTAVQEPQVIWQSDTKVLRMWYRGGGWSSPSSVGVADSTDMGKTWTKYSGNPVYVGKDAVSADCAGQPWVYIDPVTKIYWLFTTNNHPARTCVARSTDGLHWSNASDTSATAIPLPPGGALFGNRAVWKEANGTWFCLQEVMAEGVWQVFLYKGTSPLSWTVVNNGQPLRDLQRYPKSMYGGIHIATIDGVFSPKNSEDGLYHAWFHAGQHGNLPTDIYHATTSDLIHWTVSPGPAISHVGKGSFSFDQVADPSPLTVGNVALMAYDGDNNGCHNCSHAAIGMGQAKAV